MKGIVSSPYQQRYGLHYHTGETDYVKIYLIRNTIHKYGIELLKLVIDDSMAAV